MIYFCGNSMKSATIITVYKRYNYVAQAIRSLVDQTDPPDQVIIVADDPDKLKEISLVKELPNLTLLKADYPDLGRKIASSVDTLYEDIDIVFLLEDDDMFKANKIERIKEYFEKDNNIVMIHNHQINIDENGNPIENYATQYLEKSQPKEEIMVTRNNVASIFLKYPAIHHNNSSISLKKIVLKKYRYIIDELKLNLDFSLFFLSLLEGHILHIPDRLTYYRVGSGATFYGNKLTYDEFIKISNKQICVMNLYLEDKRKILQALDGCSQCVTIVERDMLSHEVALHYLNSYYSCDYKARVPDARSLITRSIEYFFKRKISLADLVYFLAIINLSFILGKKKLAEFILARKYRRIVTKKTI